MTMSLATRAPPRDEPAVSPRVVSTRPAPRPVAPWLFLTSCAVYLASASGHFRVMDEYEAYWVVESFVERGELSLAPEKAFFGKVGADGRFWPPYGPLQSIVAAPAYLASKALAGSLDCTAQQAESLGWLFASWTNAVLAALGVVLFWQLARALGARPRRAAIAALIFAFATPWWHYATTFFSEPLSGVCLLAACLWLVIELRDRRDAGPSLRIAVTSLPLALLVVSRLPLAIFCPALALGLLTLSGGPFGRRCARVAVYSALPILAVAAYLAWNAWRFGDALDLGYPPSTESTRPSAGFTTPLHEGLWGLLLSPGKGLAIFAPAAVLGLACCGRLWRAAGGTALWLLAIPLVPLFFYATYTYWEGGYCFGPRYLLPSLGLWLLPLAFWTPKWRVTRYACLAAVLATAAWTLLATTLSFIECQAPWGYYAEGYLYDASYSAVPATLGAAERALAHASEHGLMAAAPGSGLENWAVFLAKDGFSALTLGLLTGGQVLAAAAGAIVLASRLRKLSPEE